MKFVLGVVAGFILIPVLVFAYLLSGFGPTAATDKPFPFETWIAGTALQEKMQKDAPTRDLSTMTTADLLAGAETYKSNCAVCHGFPDQPPATIGDGMFPPAPQLMAPPPPRGRGPGPQGGPPAANSGQSGANGPNGAPRQNSAAMGTVQGRGASGDFWRVKNGIRLTGMPSFEKVLTDDQMWQVVALIANRRNLPPEVKAALALTSAPAAVPAVAGTSPAAGPAPR
jgi:mono/diheme cytochrome c family protein